MREILELRVNAEFADLLFSKGEGKYLGTTVKVVKMDTSDPRYERISIIDKELKKKYNERFYFGWNLERKYGKKELDDAKLLHLKIKKVFEPTGEECGTVYDESTSCEFCGANRTQVGMLELRKDTVPKKDIARTIGGEVVVSEVIAKAIDQWNIKGVRLLPTNISKCYQLISTENIRLSNKTIVGVNPFDLSTRDGNEIYKCPNGDTIGLNLLSEPVVDANPLIGKLDFFSSTQKLGVERGLLRPNPIYFCSQLFREMVKLVNLTGLDFEVADIE